MFCALAHHSSFVFVRLSNDQTTQVRIILCSRLQELHYLQSEDTECDPDISYSVPHMHADETKSTGDLRLYEIDLFLILFAFSSYETIAWSQQKLENKIKKTDCCWLVQTQHVVVDDVILTIYFSLSLLSGFFFIQFLSNEACGMKKCNFASHSVNHVNI